MNDEEKNEEEVVESEEGETSEDRLDSWLSSTYGVDRSEYHRLVGKNWLLGMAKRVFNPGIRMDNILVLDGDQGLGKSSSLSLLVGTSHHEETTLSIDSKDLKDSVSRYLIVEFSEGSTHRKSDVDALKSFVTKLVDNYRPSYGRIVEEHKRKCVFAMTANNTELKDSTGNRRFWIVDVDKIDIKWLKENKDQLLAEAYKRGVIDNERHWLDEEEKILAEEVQENHRIPLRYEEIVVDWFDGLLPDRKKVGLTVEDAARGINSTDWEVRQESINVDGDKYWRQNVARVFKDVLKLKKIQKQIDGKRQKKWFVVDQNGYPADLDEQEEKGNVKTPIQKTDEKNGEITIDDVKNW